MRRARVAAAVGLLLAGCAGGGPRSLAPPAGASWPVYVVSNGWHTGLVVEATRLPQDRWPQRRELADARFLEVGWGDRDAYPAERMTARLALRAAFGSRGSALLVTPFEESPAERFRGLDLVELAVDAAGLDRLAAFIEASYAPDPSGRPIPLGSGWAAPGTFYLARGRFGLLNTCNTWTARALRAAGVPVRVTLTLTAEHLMRQLERLGRPVRSPPG